MEKILEIMEVENVDGCSGFAVRTTEQVIHLLIANQQQCCETWGYFWTNDNTYDFIGSDLLSVSVVDDCLNVQKLNDVSDGIQYEGVTMFVNLETSKGTLQFTAYNEHNGYYSHEAKVISKQLNHESWI